MCWWGVQVGMPVTQPAPAFGGSAADVAARLMNNAGVAPEPDMGPHFEAELEINDFPQHARWKVGRPAYGLLECLAACGFA